MIWLKQRGLSQKTIEDLLPYIPETMNELPVDDFYDADSIMNSDRWFYWPDQTRFVLVGQCPNGDGVAIDTEINPGCIYYISHDLLHDKSIEDIIVRVADSPSDYVKKRSLDDFTWDFWEAIST
ncbi:MAG: hypothetical protein HC887_05255 [Desulfobacteraceae bacterium]|nr:hypothetical protein [Desulfobacteraceae bacterium]